MKTPAKFAPGPFSKWPGVDYEHHSPFKSWNSARLTSAIEEWLACNPPRLELATLAFEELRDRHDDLHASMIFVDAGLEPIPWLLDAIDCVRDAFPPPVLETQKEGKLTGSVYVMLRSGYSTDNGFYGAYVGSTKKTPEKRCLEHRTGIRSGRGLPRYGIEPLWTLFDFINPVPVKRDRLMEWETRLHEALAQVVPKVTGDVAF